MAVQTRLDPPDGGWGILVCVGMALPFISGLSSLPSFGLVFGDFLKGIGAETSAIAFITSFFFCALSFTGLFSGSLFNRFGLRAVGFCGAVLYFVGSVAQVFVNSTWTLTIAFSILQGSGFGLIVPTSYTTFNNYFVKKRVMWMSFAQSLIGLGCMLYPVLMQKLLDWYGFRGCLLVLAALNSHALLGMLLMQPVEWHLVEVRIEEPEELKDIVATTKTAPQAPQAPQALPPQPQQQQQEQPTVPAIITRKATFLDCEMENGQSENGQTEHDAVNHLAPLMQETQKHSKFSKEDLKKLSSRSSSILSLGNWTGPIVVSDASPELIVRSRAQSIAISLKDAAAIAKIEQTEMTLWEKLVDFLDLTLLKNPIYVNIVLGMSFALYSGMTKYKAEFFSNIYLSTFLDISFFTLQPLYLFEIGFTKHETASVIAIGAAADLASRLFLAFSAIFIQMPSRYIYLAGSFFTIIARFAFLTVVDFKGMACITAVMGFLRTWIHVTLPLVFAEYLPKERYGTGYGLFMFLQGNILFLLGPIVGYLRDATKNYELVFHILCFFMALCAVPWIIEIVCIKFRRKQKIGTNL